MKSRILFFLLLLYLAQHEALQVCDGIMLNPCSLLHPLLNTSSREVSVMLEPFIVGGPELNAVGGKKRACSMTIKSRN